MFYSENQVSQMEQSKEDYKALYQAQHNMRIHYQKKAQIMEIRLKKVMQNKSKEVAQKNPVNIITSLKNFKVEIPKSQRKQINIRQTIEEQDQYKLISNFAIYGIPDSLIKQPDENDNDIFQGQTLFTSDNPSQIIMHSAKLVFPSGASLKKYYGFEAKQKCLQIMSYNYNMCKSFILSFQPPQKPSISQNIARKSKDNIDDLLLRLNPEKRMYAICISVPEFTNIQNTKFSYSLPDTDQMYQAKKSTSISCTDTQSSVDADSDICIGYSPRVYCIFTHYPIFPFFEEVLKSLVNIVKMQRLVFYREYENIAQTDSTFHLRRVKQVYYKCVEELTKLTKIKMDQVYQVKLINYQRICLHTNKQLTDSFYINEWIYPILKLFNVQSFINVFTLIMLQQKMVFVCQNQHILTYLVFLFTNILPRPFNYPYPVVTMIPDQQEYLNAPFPVVYGYLKSKNKIIDHGVHKMFRNVYVFADKDGIEIVSYESKKHILSKKSNKLREKLAPWFQKLNLCSIKKNTNKLQLQEEYEYYAPKKNIETASIIIQEVRHYMEQQIHALIPTKAQLHKMKKQVGKQLKECQDLTHEVYKKMLVSYEKRSKDPFFHSFLQTQLLNVYIFQ